MAAERYLEFDIDFFNKYATLEYYVGNGSSGNVHGPIPWNGMQLAIKHVAFSHGKVTDKFRKDIEVKKEIWTSLEHKHLMRIYSVDLSQLPKAMFIVMEFATGGSLNETLGLLRPGNKLPIHIVTEWAKQIADGMLYLHRKNIVHRDLKSSNILLMEPFKACNSPTLMTLKIADFDDIKQHDHTATMSSLVGTCAYMAPEVLEQERFSKVSDVWSFGVVIWEMLSGDIPYKGLCSKEIFLKSVKGELGKLHIENSFPADYRLLLIRCWESTYKERLTFHEIFYVLQQMADGIDVTEILKYPGDTLPKYFQQKLKVSDKENKNEDISKRWNFTWRGLTRNKVSKQGELREIYKSDPNLIATIRTFKSIRGITILDKELFVVGVESSTVEIYDSIELSYIRRLILKELGLIDPMDIVSCSKSKCLYISDCKKFSGQFNEILRVDPSGKLIKKWSTDFDDGWSLSVTMETNVILTAYGKSKLNEYSPDGQLIREINLLAAEGIHFPLHAVRLTNGHFVVSHSFGQHRVCVMNTDGELLKSISEKIGSTSGQMDRPVYLSVVRNGCVLVADQGNSRILLLDANLEFKLEILSIGQHRFRNPERILLDESSGRMFVADDDSRILSFYLPV